MTGVLIASAHGAGRSRCRKNAAPPRKVTRTLDRPADDSTGSRGPFDRSGIGVNNRCPLPRQLLLIDVMRAAVTRQASLKEAQGSFIWSAIPFNSSTECTDSGGLTDSLSSALSIQAQGAADSGGTFGTGASTGQMGGSGQSGASPGTEGDSGSPASIGDTGDSDTGAPAPPPVQEDEPPQIEVVEPPPPDAAEPAAPPPVHEPESDTGAGEEDIGDPGGG
jgi:hypothetical protein